jgi:hypothetical protein
VTKLADAHAAALPPSHDHDQRTAAHAPQVVDYYQSKVVQLEAAKPPETVAGQIRQALSKIKHADD